LKFEKKSRDHETIFLNHYDWLLDWARQHTQGASEEAEDLVQDLYVRFVQMKSGPAFTDDDQIRAYLYTSLRNLFISKKLRSGRDAVSGLLTVDFDSVAFAMSAVDRSHLLYGGLRRRPRLQEEKQIRVRNARNLLAFREIRSRTAGGS
jgi:DNA-directed RNA polymerase specialized sigma24 family protein